VPDFRSQIKTNQIPVLDLVPFVSASAPAGPAAGQAWYNTAASPPQLQVYSGSAWVPAMLVAGIVTDAMVAAGAAIAESKLSLATDAVAGTGSRRTLGAGAQQAMAGNATLATISAASAPAAAVAFGGQRATGVADPSSPTSQDAATANWVTSQITAGVTGQDWKQSVAAATAAALAASTYLAGTITATGNGALTVDGVAAVAGMRILVKDEATAANNGVYAVSSAGGSGAAWVLTRAADAASSSQVSGGMTVPVDAGGTANAGTVWLLATAETVTIGTTALPFTQIGAGGTSYSAGAGLTLAGNVFALVIPVTVASGGTGATTAAGARGNLGAPGLYNSAAIGDGSATTFTVTHNLNDATPMVTVWDVSGASPVQVECDVTAPTVNTVSLAFAAAPAASSVKCTVVG
jgi:hypothetical protein